MWWEHGGALRNPASAHPEKLREADRRDMRFMANSRIAEGVTPEQLQQFIDDNNISSPAWELVRHRVVTDYAF